MEIDAAPEEPAPPLGPGPKLGTVVTMVEFREKAATGQQPYYQDHHMRAEAQRCKSEATERRILETFYGVPASTWEAAASLPLVNSSPEQRMGYQQVSEWKKTLRVGDKVDVTFRGFWHEAVIRTVPDLTNMSGHSLTYARFQVGLSAFDGEHVHSGGYGNPIAPRGMFVGNWRASLAVGDRVEARLDDNTWAMARVTAAAADADKVKPKAPRAACLLGARGGGADICLLVVAGDTFQASLDAGGIVNKGDEHRMLVRDTETFGNLRRAWAQQHGLQESELTLWSRQAPAPARGPPTGGDSSDDDLVPPAPAPPQTHPHARSSLGSFGLTVRAPAPVAATTDVKLDVESCARDHHLAGTATIVVTKNLDVVTTEATGTLELSVVFNNQTLELPRSSPRLTRAGTHCRQDGLTKLKALELIGPAEGRAEAHALRLLGHEGPETVPLRRDRDAGAGVRDAGGHPSNIVEARRGVRRRGLPIAVAAGRRAGAAGDPRRRAQARGERPDHEERVVALRLRQPPPRQHQRRRGVDVGGAPRRVGRDGH